VPQSSAVTDPQGHGEDRSGQQTDAGLMPWDMPRFRNWIAVAKVHGLVEKAMAAAWRLCCSSCRTMTSR